MNELSTMIVDGERMTSLQIAEITARLHKNVMRAIRNMEPAWEKINGRKFELVDYKDEKGETRPCYYLNKEECLYIATKFNDEARAKLIKRWKELEEQHQKPSVPQNYLEALESLVKAEKEKQQLALENKQKDETIITISKANVELGNKITEMLPKVSYYDRILQSNATMTITQIAQDYGMSAIAMNKELESMRIQHKERGQWILYAQFLKGGYVHSRAVDIIRRDGRHDVKYNTEWTTKGRLFLYEALKGKGILPLIEQENTPTEIRALVEESLPRRLVPVSKPLTSSDMKEETIKSDIEETNKSSLGETLARIEKYILIGTKNVLNIDEAAIVLGVTIRTLRKMVSEHTLPIYKPNQRALYFKKSDLEDWMLQNRVKPQSEIDSEVEAYCITH